MKSFGSFLCLFISVSFSRQHVNYTGTLTTACFLKCFFHAPEIMSIDGAKVLKAQRFKKAGISPSDQNSFQQLFKTMNGFI